MDRLMEQCASAVAELDRALGGRASGAIIASGAQLGFRGVRGQESPFLLTRRTMVDPVMSMMGYGAPRYDLDGPAVAGDAVLGMVPMNRPVEGPIFDVLQFMRGRPAERGIATDGFTWVLIRRGRLGPAVGLVADLRPYYVEALDMARFRSAVPADRTVADAFLRGFGPSASRGGRPPSRPGSRRRRRPPP